MAKTPEKTQNVQQNTDLADLSTGEVTQQLRDKFRTAAGSVESPQHKTPNQELHDRHRHDNQEYMLGSQLSSLQNKQQGRSDDDCHQEVHGLQQQVAGGSRKKRSRRRSGSIPDSIQQLMDQLETSLSEDQVQEALEKAVEDLSAGQVSKEEIRSTREEIWQHIQNALANGDLMIPQELIDQIEKLLLKSERLISAEMPELDPEVVEQVQQPANEVSEKPSAQEMQRMAQAINVIVEAHPDILEDPEALAICLAEHHAVSSTWLQHAKQEGLRGLSSQLAEILKQEVSLVMNANSARAIAEQVILVQLLEILAPVITHTAGIELRERLLDISITAREKSLSEYLDLFEALPLLKEAVDRNIEIEMQTIEAAVEVELGPYIERLDQLHKSIGKGRNGECEVLAQLHPLSPTALRALIDVYQERFNTTFKEDLRSLFPGDSHEEILTGLLEEHPATRKAIEARVLALEPTEGVRESYVTFMSDSTREEMLRYEVLFGDLTKPLSGTADPEMRKTILRLVATRDEDLVLGHALQLTEVSLNPRQRGEDEYILPLAKALREVPVGLREQVLERFKEEFADRYLKYALATNNRYSRSGSYIKAVVDNDQSRQIAAQLWMMREDEYHSFVDILGLYADDSELLTSPEVAAAYKQLTGQKLDFKQFLKTQVEQDTSESDIPRQIVVARWKLLSNVLLKEDLSQQELQLVLAHEAQLLGKERAAAEAERSNSGGEYGEAGQLARELNVLQAIALKLEGELQTNTLIVQTAHDEAHAEELIRQYSLEVWEMGREQRVQQGMAERKPDIEQKIERYLIDKGIVDNKRLADALREHWKKSYDSFDRLFTQLEPAANRIFNAVDGWNPSQAGLVRALTEGRHSNLYRMYRDQRKCFFDKEEIVVIGKIFPTISSGYHVGHRINKDHGDAHYKKYYEKAVNPYYAAEGRLWSQELPNIEDYYSKTEDLLSRLKEADSLTVEAIDLRNEIRTGEPLELMRKLVQSENAKELLARFEELYGLTFQEMIKKELPSGERIMVPHEVEGIGGQIISAQNLLREVSDRILLEGLSGDRILTENLTQKMKYYTEHRLQVFAFQEAELVAGQLQSRSLRTSCFLRYDPALLRQVRERREKFQQSNRELCSNTELLKGFDKDCDESFVDTLEGLTNEAVKLNYQQLRYHSLLAERTGKSRLVSLHENALNRYSNTHKKSVASFVSQEWEQQLDSVLRRKLIERYKLADKVASDLYGHMWGWGTYEDEIHADLRKIDDPHTRWLMQELYSVKYGVDLTTRFKEEMDGYDSRIAFAYLRGDTLVAETITMEMATTYWTTGDSTIMESSTRVVNQLDRDARKSLRSEAGEKEFEAQQAELHGDTEQVRRLRIAAYHLLEASTAESHDNELLRGRISRLQDGFRATFNRTTQYSDLDFSSLIHNDSGNPEKLEALYLQDTDPDRAFLLNLEHSMSEKENEAGRLIEKERDKVLQQFLTLNLTIDEKGEFVGGVASDGELAGQFVVDGHVIRGEVLQDFYASQMRNAQLQLLKANTDDSLAKAAELDEFIFSAEQESFAEFAKNLFNIEVSATQEGEAVEQLLTLFLFDIEQGIPTEQNVQQFKQFYNQRVLLPHYQEAIANGTLFSGEPHPEIKEAWDARLTELATRIPGRRGDEQVTMESFIKDNCSGQFEKWLLAEVQGDLDVAAACRIKRDLDGDGESDAFAHQTLLPPALLAMLKQADREKAQIESVLSEGDKTALRQKKSPDQVSDEIRARVGTSLINRYYQLVDTRQKITSGIESRGKRIEQEFDSRFKAHRNAHGNVHGLASLSHSHSHSNYSLGMWDRLEIDLGRNEATCYRKAVQQGELTDAMRMKIALGDDGWWSTHKDDLMQVIGVQTSGGEPRTKEQLITLAEEFCALDGEESLSGDNAFDHMRNRILWKVSGDDQLKAEVAFVGIPQTAAQMSAIMQLHKQQLDSGMSFGVADDFREDYKKFKVIYNELSEAERTAKPDKDHFNSGKARELEIIMSRSVTTANLAITQRNMAADMVVNTASTIVVVGGSIIILTASGGTAAPLLIFIAAAATSRVGLKKVLKGNSYGQNEMIVDGGMVVVDVASLGAGVLITKGIQKATGHIVARFALRKAGDQAVQQTVKTTATAATSATKQAATHTALNTTERLAGQGWRVGQAKIENNFFSRTAQNIVDGAFQGGVDGLAIGSLQQGLHGENWSDGFWSGMVNMGYSGSRMALLSAGIGGIASPVLNQGFRSSGAALRMGGRVGMHVPGVRHSTTVRQFANWAPPKASLLDVDGNVKFVSQHALESSSTSVEKARNVAEDANLLLIQKKGKLSPVEEANLQFDRSGVPRLERAQSKASRDAEMLRVGGLDEQGMKQVLLFREAQVDLHLARSERWARTSQRFKALISRDDAGLNLSLKKAVQESKEKIVQAKKTARALKRKVQVEAKATERVARTGAPYDPTLKKIAKGELSAKREFIVALCSGDLEKAGAHWKRFRGAAKRFYALSQKKLVDATVVAERQNLTRYAERVGLETADPKVKKYFDEIEAKIEGKLRANLNAQASKRVAWRNFFRLQGWPPGSAFPKWISGDKFALSSAQIRQNMRQVRDLQGTYLHAGDVQSSINRTLIATKATPEIKDTVVRYHLAELDAQVAKQIRKRTFRRFVSDTVFLKWGSLKKDVTTYFGNISNRMKAKKVIRQAAPQIDEAKYYTQAIELLDPTKYRELASLRAAAQAKFKEHRRILRQPIISTIMMIQDSAANIARIAKREPLKPFRRSPLGLVVEGAKVMNRKRPIRSAQRVAALTDLVETSLDRRTSEILRKMKLDKTPKALEKAQAQAMAELQLLIAKRSSTHSALNFRDLPFTKGTTNLKPKAGLVGDFDNRMMGSAKARKVLLDAHDEVRIVRRQQQLEKLGKSAVEAEEIATKEVRRLGAASNAIYVASEMKRGLREGAERFGKRFNEIDAAIMDSPRALAKRGYARLMNTMSESRRVLRESSEMISDDIAAITRQQRAIWSAKWKAGSKRDMQAALGTKNPKRVAEAFEELGRIKKELAAQKKSLIKQRAELRADEYVGFLPNGTQRDVTTPLNKFAAADAEISGHSKWNPRRWFKRATAHWNLRTAKSELSWFNTRMTSKAHAETVRVKYLKKGEPTYRDSESMDAVLSQLSLAEGRVYRYGKLISQEMKGSPGARWMRAQRIQRYRQMWLKAKHEQMIWKRRFVAEVRIEKSTKKLHAQLGGGENTRTLCREYAEAAEGLRYVRDHDRFIAARRGQDISKFNEGAYSRAYERAHFEYGIELIRAKYGAYRGIAEAADKALEEIDLLIGQLTKDGVSPSSFTRRRQQRALTKDLRKAVHGSKFVQKLDKRLEGSSVYSPHHVDPNVRRFVDGEDLTADQYIAKIKEDLIKRQKNLRELANQDDHSSVLKALDEELALNDPIVGLGASERLRLQQNGSQASSNKQLLKELNSKRKSTRDTAVRREIDEEIAKTKRTIEQLRNEREAIYGAPPAQHTPSVSKRNGGDEGPSQNGQRPDGGDSDGGNVANQPRNGGDGDNGTRVPKQSDIETRKVGVQDQLDAARLDKKAFEQEQQILVSKQQQVKAEVDELKVQKASAEEQAAKLQQEHDALASKHQEVTEKHNSEVKRVEEGRRLSETEIEKVKKQQADLQQEIAGKESRIKEETAKRIEIEAEHGKSKERLKSVDEYIENKKVEHQQLKEQSDQVTGGRGDSDEPDYDLYNTEPNIENITVDRDRLYTGDSDGPFDAGGSTYGGKNDSGGLPPSGGGNDVSQSGGGAPTVTRQQSKVKSGIELDDAVEGRLNKVKNLLDEEVVPEVRSVLLKERELLEEIQAYQQSSDEISDKTGMLVQQRSDSHLTITNETTAINALTDELTVLQRQLDELSDGANVEVDAAIRNQLGELQERLAIKRSEMQQLTEQADRTTQQVDALQNELDVHTAQIGRLDQKVAGRQNAIDTFQDKVDSQVITAPPMEIAPIKAFELGLTPLHSYHPHVVYRNLEYLNHEAGYNLGHLPHRLQRPQPEPARYPYRNQEAVSTKIRTLRERNRQLRTRWLAGRGKDPSSKPLDNIYTKFSFSEFGYTTNPYLYRPPEDLAFLKMLKEDVQGFLGERQVTSWKFF